MRNYAVTTTKDQPRIYIFFDGTDLPKEGTVYARGARESAQLRPENIATFYQITDNLGRVRDDIKKIGFNPNISRHQGT